MSKITVAVRVRPQNERERSIDRSEVISVQSGRVTVSRPSDEDSKSFTFDVAYSSHEGERSYATQGRIYSDIGKPILEEALRGINQCLFAYGQTGSGKSYTMTGYNDPGIIPRLTEDLFERVRSSPDQIKVWVSYLEIYNERIRDLLRSSDSDEDNLNIFEHQKHGVVVPDATVSPVKTIEDVKKLMEYGLMKRASAVTSMNATSSRSHAIYTLHIETKTFRSKINLIDLAGSERVTKSKVTEENQREAGMINQSLTNLGMVIKGLSEGKGFVPFRNSKLTFLLKDSLAGNSRTYMIAAVSPGVSEIEETISTLRFASNVKKIITNPQVNYGTHEDLIETLKAEIADLKAQLGAKPIGEEPASPKTDEPDLSGVLKLKSAVLQMMKASFDRKLVIARHKDPYDDRCPYLMNICDDPLLAGVLAFQLRPGETYSIGSDSQSDKLVIRGQGIVPNMAVVTVDTQEDVQKITLRSDSENVLVNNIPLLPGIDCGLLVGDVVTLGTSNMFRLVVPGSSPRSPKRKTSVVFPQVDDLESLIRTHWRQPLVSSARADEIVAEAQKISPKIDLANSNGPCQYFLRVLLPSGKSATDPDQECVVVEVKRLDGLREVWDISKFLRLADNLKQDGLETPESSLQKVLESLAMRADAIEKKQDRLSKLSRKQSDIISQLNPN